MKKNSQIKLLLIEDEEPIREMLRFSLKTGGFSIQEAGTGQAGLKILEGDASIDLLILDWMLPDQSGLDVLKKIRENPRASSLPVIMLTARAEEADKVRALSLGADDYVVKPFSPLELMARIQAILRRTHSVSPNVIECAGLKLNVAEHKAFYRDQLLELTLLEFKLLAHFCKHPGQTFSREQLLNSVWDRAGYVNERTVDAHVKSLRKALKAVGASEMIQTERSLGYVFRDQALPPR